MNFKYYHGTSTIFLESIKETGLGGINPNIAFKNLDVLKFLHTQAESLLYDNPYYLTLRDTTKAMALQRDNKYWVDELGLEVVHNYKHSGIYVGLDIIRAVIYASSNKYGSLNFGFLFKSI